MAWPGFADTLARKRVSLVRNHVDLCCPSDGGGLFSQSFVGESTAVSY